MDSEKGRAAAQDKVAAALRMPRNIPSIMLRNAASIMRMEGNAGTLF